MKANTASRLLSLGLAVSLACPAGAATYLWTGTTSTNTGLDSNWSGNLKPPGTIGSQINSPAADTVVFDSTTWTRAPETLYTRTNAAWGSIELKNGTIGYANDGNNQGNYSFSGTNTLVAGDGIGAASTATINFNVMNWNQGGTTGTKTYVINSDGRLVSNRGGLHTWSNGANYDTVMRLLGGSVSINGAFTESHLTGDAGDYVSFETIGSLFTFNKGIAGQFDDATDVTSAFGDSFRLGGSLNSGNAALQLTDNTTSWTISAIAAVPEPSAALLGGLGMLALLLRRR